MKATIFTAYLVQPKPGTHASLFGQTTGDLKLLLLTIEEVVFLKTSAGSLIFTKLLGFYLFLTKSLYGLYNSNCKHCITPNFINFFAVLQSFFALSLTALSTYFISGFLGRFWWLLAFLLSVKVPWDNQELPAGSCGAYRCLCKVEGSPNILYFQQRWGRWAFHEMGAFLFPRMAQVLSQEYDTSTISRGLSHQETEVLVAFIMIKQIHHRELNNQIIFLCCFLVLGLLVLIWPFRKCEEIFSIKRIFWVSSTALSRLSSPRYSSASMVSRNCFETNIYKIFGDSR